MEKRSSVVIVEWRGGEAAEWLFFKPLWRTLSTKKVHGVKKHDSTIFQSPLGYLSGVGTGCA
jgi:hypothetical protein